MNRVGGAANGSEVQAASPSASLEKEGKLEESRSLLPGENPPAAKCEDIREEVEKITVSPSA